MLAKRILYIILLIVLLAPAGFVSFFCARVLYGVSVSGKYVDDPERFDKRVSRDAVLMYEFLSKRIRDKGARTRLNGEWEDMFTLAFYGYFVSNLLHSPQQEIDRDELAAELRWTIDEYGRNGFRKKFSIDGLVGGVMYQGQKNLLMGSYLLAGLDDPAIEAEFHGTSAMLNAALARSPYANIESYPGRVFPVDNLTALYSLTIHDHLYGTDYAERVSDWISFVDGIRDEETGLFMSGLKTKTGKTVEGPRGCALSWTFSFLGCMEPEFSRGEYMKYRSEFFGYGGGYAAVRDYPRGIGRVGDIDSGPIVFGYGTVASGIGMAAARISNDPYTFRHLWRLMETFGFPSVSGREKFYTTDTLLLHNVFAAWAITSNCWMHPVSGDTVLTAATGLPQDRLLGAMPLLLFVIFCIAFLSSVFMISRIARTCILIYVEARGER